MTDNNHIVKQSQATTPTAAASLLTDASIAHNVSTMYPQMCDFLSFLYDGMRGYAEIVFADGDPDEVDLKRYKWLYLDGDYTTVATIISDLAAKYGNVYVGRTLYAAKKRSKLNAISSSVILIDDAPANPPMPYSLTVRSGGGLPQAYYRLSQPTTSMQNELIARACAKALSADKSGSDITQLIRVPGTFNTKKKYGNPVPVRILQQSSDVYAVDDLLGVYPIADTHEAQSGELTHWDADVQEIMNHNSLLRVQYILANISQLLDGEGVPARIGSDPRIRSNFTGNKEDASLSRYTIAKSLLIKGYAHDEIMALVIHFAQSAKKNKTMRDAYTDAARCVVKHQKAGVAPRYGVHAAFADADATNAPLMKLPSEKTAVDHRPTKLDVASFYEWLKAEELNHDYDGVIPFSRKEIASRFSVSTDTIVRIERQLTQANKVKRILSANKQASFLLLKQPTTSMQNVPPTCMQKGGYAYTSQAGNSPLQREIPEKDFYYIVHAGRVDVPSAAAHPCTLFPSVAESSTVIEPLNLTPAPTPTPAPTLEKHCSNTPSELVRTGYNAAALACLNKDPEEAEEYAVAAHTPPSATIPRKPIDYASMMLSGLDTRPRFEMRH